MPQYQENNRVFNNADSFAMAFDEAWKKQSKNEEMLKESIDNKINYILNQVKDHPFFQENPLDAKKIAIFRVRLLDLK